MQLISNLPLHFQKRLYRFFNLRAIAKGDNNVKGVYVYAYLSRISDVTQPKMIALHSC